MIKGTVLIGYTCSNIPAKPTYGVYVSQLIRICDSFLTGHRLLTEILIKQGICHSKLCMSFKKFAKRHSVLFNKYAVCVRNHIMKGIRIYFTRCET